MPLLSFRENKFALTILEDDNIAFASNEHRWTWNKKLEIYQTTDLKAAFAYKEYSDKTTAKILNNASQSFYTLPTLSPRLLKILDPHQVEGLKWILTRKRSYLAHAPGAGKTAQAIIASHMANLEWYHCVIFVVPPSLSANWLREISQWGVADQSIAVVPESKQRVKMNWNADIIIVPDSMLTKDWVYSELKNLLIGFLGVDEASRFKDPESERTLALFGGEKNGRTYRGLFQRARHTVLLDGSPMPNRHMEFWAPTYALHPLAIEGMGRHAFGKRYCGATINDRGNWEYKFSTNGVELSERLRKDFMHVVGEESLEHPERRRSLIFIDKDVRSGPMIKWEKNSLAGLSFDDELSVGKLAEHRKLLGLKKIPFTVKYIRDRMENNSESILLLAWHREVALQLCKRLEKYEPGLVIGGTRESERENYFSDFQSRRRRLLIGNISAMGRGHNLQSGTRVVFCEHAWSDETNVQAEKRVSRRGNDRSWVPCEYIIAPNSIDMVTLKSVFRKQEDVRRVMRGEE